MQHDLDYDRAWDKVSQKFWRRRGRELVIHVGLFGVAHILGFFIRDFLGTTFFTGYPPLIILRQLGIENMAYTTFFWGTILIIHLLILAVMALGERIFRYSVERELLRDFAQANSMNEKRKMRPPYAALSEDEENFDMMDEAQEITSRQSTR